MAQLEAHVEPDQVGLDSRALERVSAYLDGYVSTGRLAGWLVTLSRGPELAWVGRGGHRDREANRPVEDDTLWRLYSMTKPITSIGAMMLYEEGAFDLNDDVGQWIDELAEPRVYVSGPASDPVTMPSPEPVRVQHLLSHTSGLTYGFQYRTPVDAMYRERGYDMFWPEEKDLGEGVHDWCTLPLLFAPGTAWNYSVATDVLGRLIEIWSGQSLDDFLFERVLGPLGMNDTTWWTREDQLERLAALYVHDGQARRQDELGAVATRATRLLSGGGGLLSSAGDYQRFMSMLLGQGRLGETRLISARTLDLMASNHLPGGADLASFARDSFSEVGQSGVGFGLGFSVVLDRVANRSLVSPGTIAWGGAASTYFWVDRTEGLAVALYTQLLPSWTYPLRRDLQQLVYSALRA